MSLTELERDHIYDERDFDTDLGVYFHVLTNPHDDTARVLYAESVEPHADGESKDVAQLISSGSLAQVAKGLEALRKVLEQKYPSIMVMLQEADEPTIEFQGAFDRHNVSEILDFVDYIAVSVDPYENDASYIFATAKEYL